LLDFGEAAATPQSLCCHLQGLGLVMETTWDERCLHCIMTRIAFCIPAVPEELIELQLAIVSKQLECNL
jgi:hypothetical protein